MPSLHTYLPSAYFWCALVNAPSAVTLLTRRGRLYLTAGVPSQGPPVAAGAVVVRPTGDVRGNGAFAAAVIPKGTYLGDYIGELLDRAAFFQRYPDGVVRAAGTASGL